MKILPFHDGFNAIRKQLKEINEKIESNDLDASNEIFNKRDFLNSVILESMNESEREKEQILNSLVEKVCYLDLEYNIKWINDAGLKTVPPNVSMDSILGQPCYRVLHGRKEPCEFCPVTTTLKTGWAWKEEVTHSDGTTHLVSAQPVVDDNGSISGIIEIELDITVRKEVERALEKSQQRARALLDVIPDVLLVFNNEGKIIEYHPAADFDILTDTHFPEGKHLSTVMPKQLADSILMHTETLTEPGLSRTFEFSELSEDTDIFYGCRLIKTDDTENVCIIRDISSQKERENQILEKSFHDKLTGLYNRAYYEEELNRIEQSREALPTSILIIDVNSLKIINDAFGHDFGDKLLQKVATILSDNCRKSDVIARTGGDEFSIILPGSPLIKAEKLMERINEACMNTDYDDIFARPSVSIGCAERVDQSISLTEVIKSADEQMYRMKLTNRNNHLETLMNDIFESMEKHGFQFEQHIENCTLLSELFAKSLNMSQDFIDKIKQLALLHDIGNIRLSNQILSKKESLSSDEFSQIRQHSIIGYRIAKAIPKYSAIADLILYHHERWDGSGYPSGLKEKEIPLICRVFALIDAWDILTNGTRYKRALSVEESIAEIKRNSGIQFDPDITENFFNFIKNEGY